MLGLTIAAIIGLAVSTMLASISHAAADDAGLRRANVRHNVVASRLAAVFRSCKCVLAKSDDAVVLWLGDTTVNGRPDLSEIRRIEFRPLQAEIWCYAAPSGLSETDDATYQLTDDFLSITANLMDSPSFPGRLWATHVLGWTLTLDEPVTQHAALATYTLTIGDNDASTSATHIASFRSR